jgi:hypothetical protein
MPPETPGHLLPRHLPSVRAGLSMPEVMQMSGHRTTAMLMRYLHLQVEHLAAKLRVA